jgi:hypothetical protein
VTATQVSLCLVSGAIRVVASTTGIDLDPDGYTVTLDGGAPEPLSTNGSTTFADLARDDGGP